MCDKGYQHLDKAASHRMVKVFTNYISNRESYYQKYKKAKKTHCYDKKQITSTKMGYRSKQRGLKNEIQIT